MIICSSCFEYGSSGDDYEKIPINAMLKPTTPYGFSKAAASLFVLDFAKKQLNLSVAIILSFVWQGRTSFEILAKTC